MASKVEAGGGLDTQPITTKRRRDIKLVYGIGFCNFAEWSIIFPTILALLEQVSDSEADANTHLALALGLFNIGQLVGPLGASGLAARVGRAKPVFVGFMVVALLGNILYSLVRTSSRSAELASPWVVIVARLIAGFGSASGGLAYSYLAVATPKDEQQKVFSRYRLSASFASCVALVIASYIIPYIGSANHVGGFLDFNKYTEPAMFTVIVYFLLLVSTVLFFDEPQGGQAIPSKGLGSWRGIKAAFDSPVTTFGLCCGFANGFVTAIYAYLIPVVHHRKFDGTEKGIGLSFIVITAATVVGTLALERTIKWAPQVKGKEKFLLAPSLFAMVCGVVVSLVPVSLMPHSSTIVRQAVFNVGAAVAFFAYAIVSAVIPPTMSKLIPRPTAILLLPLQQTVFGVGKVAAPFAGKLFVYSAGFDAAFVITAAIVAVVAIFSTVLVVMKKFDEPVPERRQSLLGQGLGK